MKISEIKKCFDNKKSICCVEAFWDDCPFYEALSRNQSQPTAENVYNIIREVFLKMLEKGEQTPEEKKENQRRKKDLQSLSKQLYGNAYYWAKGTQWEYYILRTQERNERRKIYEKLSFLYERLSLSHVNRRYDIVYQIAHAKPFYEAVINSEYTNAIKTLEDLYDCMESVMLDILETNECNYQYFYIMNNISNIAHRDKNYWIIKNKLTIEYLNKHL
jgi:hypothetical protein